MPRRRNICFVTGTRAEFGLMRTTLDAIRSHPRLSLQLVATGMHLDRTRGRSIDGMRADGWKVDAVVPWKPTGDPRGNAVQTGTAVAGMARAFALLRPDVVLVVGDRVAAFAAAAAAHVAHVPVAHVHGGDRALGQVDDALRHAITKLAHVHFPATRRSADRIRKLGEDAWRVHAVGSPGVDGINGAAAPWADVTRTFPGVRPRRYALLVLHPTGPDARQEERRAAMILRELRPFPFDAVVTIYPNNDPGSAGIVRCWDGACGLPRWHFRRDVPRPMFLALMRDAALLIGNSSSGIIEAASFGTPVVDIGPRQDGREHGPNVRNVPFDPAAIREAIETIWNGGRPRRSRAANVYGGGDAGRRIADVLAKVPVNDRLLRKLITY